MDAVATPVASFDVEKRVGQLRALELKMKEIEAKHAEELAPFKEMKERLRSILLDFLQKTNQQNSKTANGTIYQSERVSFPISDQDLFKKHVLSEEAWELLDWKANVTASKVYMEKYKVPPPGVDYKPMIVLGVLAPVKKKVAVQNVAAVVEETEEA